MRNQTIDLLRGVAIILVVLCHTILEGDTPEDTDTLIYRVLWTLQMPLFFIISGYVTRYSDKSLNNLRELGCLLLKKSKAYLMPLIIWTFCIKFLLLGRTNSIELYYFMYNTGGYWFLASLWTITILYLVCNYFGSKLFKVGGVKHMIVSGSFLTAGFLALGVFGYFVGIDYFALKYTLYYLPFYLLGYLFGQISNLGLFKVHHGTIPLGLIAIVYFYLLLNFNFFTAPDVIHIIVLRYIASVAGCIVIAYLFSKWQTEAKTIRKTLLWFGNNSLEVYIIHFFFLGIIKYQTPYSILTLNGFIVDILNFILCLIASVSIILVIKNIPFLNRFLFYRF